MSSVCVSDKRLVDIRTLLVYATLSVVCIIIIFPCSRSHLELVALLWREKTLRYDLPHPHMHCCSYWLLYISTVLYMYM